VVLGAALTLAMALGAAGCGSSSSSSTATQSSAGTGTDAAVSTTQEAPKSDLKIGLAVDNPINDRGFNQDAVAGLKRAGKELGVQTRVVIAKTAADHVPNLASLAQQGYDLVVATGFNYAEALDTVAQKFPDTKFAIIDFSQAALKSKPANVEGLLFAMEQSGYLAGYLAGAIQDKDVPRTNDQMTVGTVGGVRMPPVDQYIAGFQAGAKAAQPSIKLLNGYSQTFTDSGACKQLALNQIEQGADVIFQVASNCGLGVIDAAKDKGIWAVGGDIDQSFLGPQILTSAMKRVGVAVFETATSVQDGTFEGGRDVLFDVHNGGVGLGKISPEVPADIVDEVKGVEAKMKAGEIEPPKALDPEAQ
jgi:basic membrane protein A